MRVIYAIGVRFAAGGIGTTAYHAVRGLHRHGALQRLLCSSARPTEIPDRVIRETGLPHRALRRLAIYDPYRRIEQWQGEWFDQWAAKQLKDAEIFHGWSNFARRSLVAAREAGMVTVLDWPISHHVHQYRLLQDEYARWSRPYRPIPGWRQRGDAEIAAADHVIVPSVYARDSFVAQGVSAAKVDLVTFGVDARRFAPSGERPAQPLRFLFVGQVGIRKGVPYLLEAWRRLGWRNAELWLVGRVQRSIQPLLARHSDLTGLRVVTYTSGIEELYRSAHVFVFPSLDEGSALVTYEAMATGLPLVVTANSGAVARDGREALVIPPRDVDALAAAMERLYSNPSLRAEMGQQARQRVLPLTWERYGDQIVSLYRRYLGEKETART